MKTKKLLRRIKVFFDADLRDVQRKIKSLKKVLDKLRLKEETLKQRLQHEQNPQSQAALEKKIGLVHSQRKKGLLLLRQLSSGDQAATPTE